MNRHVGHTFDPQIVPMEDLRKFVKTMPKVELHLHLEGAFTLNTLSRLIQKYDGHSAVRDVEALRARFRYGSFSQFIEAWKWKNQFFRTAEDFELSAYETMIELHRQNVVHVEAFFSPWDFENNGLPMEEITEAMLSGCRRAEKETGISWKLIADINREHSPAAGEKRIDQVLKYRTQGVIGIGLGGPEHLFPPDLFVDVFSKARQRGLFVTAHAGEALGADSVRCAMDQLHVQRIGHGIRAIEDLSVVRKLTERRIPLEVCVTSNIKTGVVRSLNEHPICKLIDADVFVTVNSDDPTMFGSTLTDEYNLLTEQLGLSLNSIRMIAYNGVDASVLTPEEKTGLRNRFDMAWSRCPH